MRHNEIILLKESTTEEILKILEDGLESLKENLEAIERSKKS
jgi:hypothetical protein